ncbi:hypothetical protein ElyMa_004059800 [Elysia marginata]|uniref:Receptor ligand binding region domain-containing protein n=1 Tax=Elysia marginata TaxID=1093978 RepID=A0AAV4G8K2_9GAST|nr:hypothetical protein ElyMa_004059800 [Elysia marginata]
MTLTSIHLAFTYTILTLTSQRMVVTALKNMRIGVLVPLTGDKSMGQEVVAAAHLGVKAMNEDRSLTAVIADDYQFSIAVSDSGCDTGQVLQKVVELSTNLATTGHKVDAFVGE